MVKPESPTSSSTSTRAESSNAKRQQQEQLKYKGVRKRKWGKWVSEIRLPNSRERIWLGSYDTAEKAARAFDVASFCLRGRSANFNLPNLPLPNISPSQSLSPSEIQAAATRIANEETNQPHHEEEEIKETVPESTVSTATLDLSGLELEEFSSSVFFDPMFDATGGVDSEVGMFTSAAGMIDFETEGDNCWWEGDLFAQQPSYLWNF
ncbi:hypothetical protein QJS10_CPB19g01940 [Acorus calamus]|uniref:AP2/ERF domain-containing protein n=1 Tax=Acorus calamus TaxID=4465 RepID=A0AAV9CIS0_ACOCL|nr:hypothetical protein QJS10_CPB19g01940 [Acorus calamus]